MKVVKVASLILLITTLSSPSSPVFAATPVPELVAGGIVDVPEPEALAAYYGTLTGEPHRYRIESPAPFTLALRVIMPYSADSKRDISVAVLDTDETDNPVAILDGIGFEWMRKEDKSDATYLAGPVWEGDLSAGRYEIRVWSTRNDSAYGLIIGNTGRGVSPLAAFLSLVILAALIVGVWALLRKGKNTAELHKEPFLEKLDKKKETKK